MWSNAVLRSLKSRVSAGLEGFEIVRFVLQTWKVKDGKLSVSLVTASFFFGLECHFLSLFGHQLPFIFFPFMPIFSLELVWKNINIGLHYLLNSAQTLLKGQYCKENVRQGSYTLVFCTGN